METKISNNKEYDNMMMRIHIIMKKGEANTTIQEENELRALALLAQEDEKKIYKMPSF